MRYLISTSLIIIGIIHLLPLSGVLGAERLFVLYGVTLDDPNLVILMRHRAVLFGLLGTLFLIAAFKPSLQALAFAFGFLSVVPFLCLAWSAGNYNLQISRIVLADLIALACLFIGIAAYYFSRRNLKIPNKPNQ